MPPRRRKRNQAAATAVPEERLDLLEDDSSGGSTHPSDGEEGEQDEVGDFDGGQEEETDVDNESGDDEGDEGEMVGVQETLGNHVGVRYRRAAAAVPRGGKKGKGKKKEVVNRANVNRFKGEDAHDVNLMTDGMRYGLKALVTCAKGHLGAVTVEGLLQRKERNNFVREYHKTAVEIVTTRLQTETVPEVVQRVFEDLDMDKLTAEEENDEQFCKLLDDYEETCLKEVDNRWSTITIDVVDQEEDYQDCLEELNKFVDRSKSSGRSQMDDDASSVAGSYTSAASTVIRSRNGKKAVPAAAASVAGTTDSRHSEGLEALTEYIPTKDPVTMQSLKDPYVNRVCGHVYEYESIIGMIRGGMAKCPYAGCTNTARVKMSDLTKDEEMAKKIAARIASEELD